MLSEFCILRTSLSCVIPSIVEELSAISDIVSLLTANAQLTENRSNNEMINANIIRLSNISVFSPPLTK